MNITSYKIFNIIISKFRINGRSNIIEVGLIIRTNPFRNDKMILKEGFKGIREGTEPRSYVIIIIDDGRRRRRRGG